MSVICTIQLGKQKSEQHWSRAKSTSFPAVISKRRDQNRASRALFGLVECGWWWWWWKRGGWAELLEVGGVSEDGGGLGRVSMYDVRGLRVIEG